MFIQSLMCAYNISDQIKLNKLFSSQFTNPLHFPYQLKHSVAYHSIDLSLFASFIIESWRLVDRFKTFKKYSIVKTAPVLSYYAQKPRREERLFNVKYFSKNQSIGNIASCFLIYFTLCLSDDVHCYRIYYLEI